MPRHCSCVDCVCKYSTQPEHRRPLSRPKPSSSSSSASDAYSDVYSKDAVSKNEYIKAIPSYPYSINLKPNIYYDEASATYSDETNNIYYKITDLQGKIRDSMLQDLKYTKNRENFEKVEKLRFRLPTNEDAGLQSNGRSVLLSNRIKEVQRIREKYRDECVGHKDEEESKHTCIHRYRLNERRFPEPALTDEDGNSLCSTCYTPSTYMMENNVGPLNCLKRFAVPHRVDSVGTRSQDAPVLVLEAPSEDSPANMFQKSQGGKGTYPFANSLALTHQRKKY